MITITKTIKSIGNFFDRMGKARLQSWLIRMGPEWAEANGYSYHDILLGLSKWPRRRSPEKIAEEKEIKRVIRELNSYNDRELRDLNIARGEIETAVRFGRLGYERDLDKAA